mmetsp:Transcript_29054/g.52928  ORF Transcript_29054/g.52928 Transcript_29054/m.52928 type:complete len:247 (-) Transcript_29054:81-821(-)
MSKMCRWREFTLLWPKMLKKSPTWEDQPPAFEAYRIAASFMASTSVMAFWMSFLRSAAPSSSSALRPNASALNHVHARSLVVSNLWRLLMDARPTLFLAKESQYSSASDLFAHTRNFSLWLPKRCCSCSILRCLICPDARRAKRLQGRLLTVSVQVSGSTQPAMVSSSRRTEAPPSSCSSRLALRNEEASLSSGICSAISSLMDVAPCMPRVRPWPDVSHHLKSAPSEAWVSSLVSSKPALFGALS